MNQSSHRILCVDDQDDANSLLERHLSRDYACTTVTSAAAALETLENDGPFAVVVSDYLMPGKNGIELFQEIQERWPNTLRVLITADEHFEVALAALNDARVFRFVRKPWQSEDVLHAVGEAVAQYRQVEYDQRLRDELARTNSELDQRLQDLDEANELLEYWVEFSPAVLYSFSLDQGAMRPSYISKNFARLTGHERTAAVIDANFWSELIHPDDRPAYCESLADLAAGERPNAVQEYHITHKSGESITVIDSVRAVHDADGKTIELVGAWLDISARR